MSRNGLCDCDYGDTDYCDECQEDVDQCPCWKDEDPDDEL